MCFGIFDYEIWSEPNDMAFLIMRFDLHQMIWHFWSWDFNCTSTLACLDMKFYSHCGIWHFWSRDSVRAVFDLSYHEFWHFWSWDLIVACYWAYWSWDLTRAISFGIFDHEIWLLPCDWAFLIMKFNSHYVNLAFLIIRFDSRYLVWRFWSWLNLIDSALRAWNWTRRVWLNIFNLIILPVPMSFGNYGNVMTNVMRFGLCDLTWTMWSSEYTTWHFVNWVI